MHRSSEFASRLAASHDTLGITKVYLPGQDRGGAPMIGELVSPVGAGAPPLPMQFGPGPDAAQETKHLKGLFLANIDLVQHQQEILIAKDRTIQSLRQENETIKSRLERIERRMSLAQQRDGATDPCAPGRADFPSTEGRGVKRKLPGSSRRSFALVGSSSAAAGSLLAESRADSSDPSGVFGRRRQTFGGRGVKVEETPGGKGELRLGEGGDLDGQDTPTHKKLFAAAPQSALRADAADVPLGSADAPPRLQSRTAVRRIRRSSEMLTTNVEYFAQPPPPPPGVDDLSADEGEGEGRGDKKPVPVPSWRINVVHGKYVIEGTENLDDHVFAKRHQKSENEEKRRKRWDLQRLRDLQLLRKQLPPTHRGPSGGEDCAPGGAEGCSGGARHDAFMSFLPDLEKVMYIEVADRIPVSAFGYPVPIVAEREFSLPWITVSESSHEERGKKTKTKK